MLAFCEEGRRRQTGPGADVPCPREVFRWRASCIAPLVHAGKQGQCALRRGDFRRWPSRCQAINFNYSAPRGLRCTATQSAPCHTSVCSRGPRLRVTEAGLKRRLLNLVDPPNSLRRKCFFRWLPGFLRPRLSRCSHNRRKRQHKRSGQ